MFLSPRRRLGDKPVIVCMQMHNPTVPAEWEPLADGILILLIGALYGPAGSGEQLMYALLLAAIAAILLIAFRHAGRKTALPFVPFLLGGFVLFLIRVKLYGG